MRVPLFLWQFLLFRAFRTGGPEDTVHVDAHSSMSAKKVAAQRAGIRNTEQLVLSVAVNAVVEVDCNREEVGDIEIHTGTQD